MKKNRRNVMLIGGAMTKPIPKDIGYRPYTAEPFFQCLDSLGLKPKDIEIFSVGYNERTHPDAAISPIFADILSGLNAPVIPVSTACAGGGTASFNIYNYIASGRFDLGASVSFSKPDVFYPMETANSMGNFTDVDHALGLTHFQYSYLRENYYQEKHFQDDLKPAAQWAWQDHWYSRRNPEAVLYGRPMPTEEQLMDRGIGGIRQRSAAGRSQACVLIFASEDVARNYSQPIYFDVGLANRSAYMGAHFHYPHPDHRECDISHQPGTKVAARMAMRFAEIELEDIDIFQIHDLTPYDGFMQMEALGITKPGEMGNLTLEGATALDGPYPTNTDGGAIGFGHSSVGGDFHSKVIENMKQLRGQGEERQVENPKVALAHAYGTHQSIDVVGIMRRGF